jgi:hypothetical protein
LADAPVPQKSATFNAPLPSTKVEHLALAVQHAAISADLPELQADAAHVPDLEL